MKRKLTGISNRISHFSKATLLLLWLGTMSSFAVDPLFISQWPGGNHGLIQAVQVRSNLAFCAISEGGLGILNLNDITSPTWVGGYNTSGSALDVVLQGNYAFVADYAAGLQV